MIKALTTALFVVMLSGCAASSGVLPVGPDTYVVTENYAPLRGGTATAQQTALTEANAYCAAMGRQLLATNLEVPASRNPYGATGYSVTFRCLLPGDPDLRRPTFDQAPTTVIEDRRGVPR